MRVLLCYKESVTDKSQKTLKVLIFSVRFFVPATDKSVETQHLNPTENAKPNSNFYFT